MTAYGFISPSGGDRSPPALARQIRLMIQSGEVLPGSHLGTVELAERFSVSRGPLREALRLLESSGLVKIVPQRGAFVIRLDDREVQDLLEQLEQIARNPASTARAFQAATYRYVAQMNVIVGSARLTQSIRDLSIGAAELYGHLAIATRDMRLKDLSGYKKLFKLIAAGAGAAAFSQARAMHSQGVARAVELNASASRQSQSSPAIDFVQRKRRTTQS